MEREGFLRRYGPLVLTGVLVGAADVGGQRSGRSSERGMFKTASYKMAASGPTPRNPLYCLYRLWYGTPFLAASMHEMPRLSRASRNLFMSIF